MKSSLLDVIRFILEKNPDILIPTIELIHEIKSNHDEHVFTDIFTHKKWGAVESVSGNGSTLDYTFNLRSSIGNLFRDFSIKSIFDAPCGDFNWMQEVLKEFPTINYTGGDIVSPLVNDLNSKFSGPHIIFKHLNIIQDEFPEVDLMICRDCLFHLPNDDINTFIKNFCRSKIKYLLTTSMYEHVSNHDINPGEFRSINLFREPFSLPNEVLYRLDDSHDSERGAAREMILWSREQLRQHIL